MRYVLVLALVAACGKDEPAKPKGNGTIVLAPKAPTIDAAPPREGARDDAAALLDLRTTAQCDDPASHLRIWCIPADGWAKAQPAPLPDASVLVGLTVELADGASIEEALKSHLALSVLALRDDAGRRLARITTVRPRPDNNDQATMVLESMANLMILFKGNGDKAAIGDDLRTYFDTLPAQATYALAQEGPGWAWHDTSSAELRKVGAWWVAIATPPGGGGRWVSIFTDRFGPPPPASPPSN